MLGCAELEQLVPAGSYAGALRTAVLQGRRQMVFHMVHSDAVQAIEPSIMAGILNTAVQHKRCGSCWLTRKHLCICCDLCEALGTVIGCALRPCCCLFSLEMTCYTQDCCGVCHMHARYSCADVLASGPRPLCEVRCGPNHACRCFPVLLQWCHDTLPLLGASSAAFDSW